MSQEILAAIFKLKDRHPVVFKDIIEKQYGSMAFKPDDAKDVSVLDLGAHVGLFSMFMLSHGAKAVVSVEANPKTFLELAENLLPFRNASFLNLAVTNGRSNTVRISDADAQSKIVQDQGAEVRTTTLEDLAALLPKDGPRLLKVDVEGAEYQILSETSGRTLRSFRTIFLETHIIDAGPGRSYEFLKEYLANLGFKETFRTPIFNWIWDKDGNVVDCKPIPNMGGWRFELDR